MPTYDVQAHNLKITPDSALVAEGRRIVLTSCITCHRGADNTLSGHLWADHEMFGKLWSANLTQHPTAGIGAYSDGELAHTLRTGIKRNGRFAGPFMTFPLMADADVAAVIAFLRSDAPEVQPSERRQPPAEPKFLGKMFYKILVKPVPYPQQAIVAPPPSDKIAWGRYLATGKWECYRCHSASFETNNDVEPEKSAGYFGGGNLIEDAEHHKAISANISPDPETGIGIWTEAQFTQAVRYGKRPDGTALNPMMPPLTVLTDAEVSALWAYLKTVPSLNNAVARIP
jgi:mono/diheme cytochrome c family protein